MPRKLISVEADASGVFASGYTATAESVPAPAPDVCATEEHAIATRAATRERDTREGDGCATARHAGSGRNGREAPSTCPSRATAWTTNRSFTFPTGIAVSKPERFAVLTTLLLAGLPREHLPRRHLGRTVPARVHRRGAVSRPRGSARLVERHPDPVLAIHPIGDVGIRELRVHEQLAGLAVFREERLRTPPHEDVSVLERLRVAHVGRGELVLTAVFGQERGPLRVLIELEHQPPRRRRRRQPGVARL